jgi:hypothetical protein
MDPLQFIICAIASIFKSNLIIIHEKYESAMGPTGKYFIYSKVYNPQGFYGKVSYNKTSPTGNSLENFLAR